MTSDALRTRRLALHLTQKQLAEVLGVSTSTISHWEIGKQAIPAYLDLALQTLERRMPLADDVVELVAEWLEVKQAEFGIVIDDPWTLAQWWREDMEPSAEDQQTERDHILITHAESQTDHAGYG